MKRINPRDPGEQWSQIPREGYVQDCGEPSICGLPKSALHALGNAGLIPIVQVRVPGSEEVFELVHLPSLNRYLISLLPTKIRAKAAKPIPKVVGVLA